MSINFKGLKSGFGRYELTDQIFYNLKLWLDWGFLNNGGFETVRRNDVSFFSVDDSRLFNVFDERFNEGRVWNGLGKEWVWESGVIVPSGGVTPFRVSGVYVDNTFYPENTTGDFAHKIDYQNGRIIFDEPINTSSVVQAEYTFKKVNACFADDPDFRTLIQFGQETQLLNDFASGISPKDHQIHLPSIFIDQRNTKQRGLELGGGQIKTKTILLHIFADHPSDRNHIMDILDKQSRSVFVTANLNTIQFPLDGFGSIASGTTNWPDLISSNPGIKIMIRDGKSFKVDSLNPNLFRARVEFEIEIDITGI